MTDQKTPPLGLSIAIITYQEADRIQRCLESVLFADEVVVVDSGSTDRTCDIARMMGARVIVHPFDGHVEQKNRALANCTHTWVLSLDADEWLSPELSAYIQAWLIKPQKANGLIMPRKNLWVGRETQFGVFGCTNVLRLVRSEHAKWFGQNPHDQLEVTGNVDRCSHVLWHDPYRSTSEHLQTIDRYATIASKSLKPSVVSLLFRPPAHFVRAYLLKLGFLDGVLGITLAVLGSYYVWLKNWRAWKK